MNTIDCKTETANAFPQIVTTRKHTFRADVTEASGSTDSAPGPHDYFDAALASCKALTATWYARKNSLPLESVDVHVERDDSQERTGTYVLRVRIEFHGDKLSADEKKRLAAAVAKCPLHKLMTTADVVIETLGGDA